MDYRPGVYLYTPPAGDPAPCVFDVPRSGREYPPGFYTTVAFNEVHFLVSHYVEEIWDLAPSVGCGLLYATFCNNWIDANRGEYDIDPALLAEPWPEPLEPSDKTRNGMGLIHSAARGHRLHADPLTVAAVRDRIENYWRPYHDRLAALIRAERERAGYALHLSCHCMGTIGPANAHDHGRRRADFCIGDRDGTTSSREAVEALAAAIRGRGYTVTFNDPFRGAESIRRHADPAGGVDSVQIEMIKELFMEEESFRRRADFERVRTDCGAIAAEMAAFARSRAT